MCTPTVKSHGPDKGTISVAAVPGSAHRFLGYASLLGTEKSEAFRVPMRGSWQVNRRKNVNLCHNCVWRKICSTPSPLPVYSSSCHCICITKKIENEVHTSRTNMQQCAPPQGSTLLIVPQCLAAARGRGFDSDGCDALPAAAILQWHLLWPRLWRLVFSQHWTKVRPICSPRRSCACTDTFRTTGY